MLPRLLFLFIIAITTVQLHGQTTGSAEARRPKIGLCLSGGGAKGFAHIGVLKVLEEAGIRPDYIAGTSMGSIIGGLYATGYSAEELEDLVIRLNWNKVLSDRIPLNEVVMEEKPFFKNQLFAIPLDNWKPRAPAAVVQGQQIDLLLESLTLPVYDVEDFDELPIPFRAIATNLTTGDIVVLKEGDLAQAMRASMAIPSIFAPVILEDSTILVDGGVVRNFPASELLRMGADIIIGVNVSKMDITPEDLNSAVEILLQTSTLIGLQDFPEQKALCDYFLNVDLDDFSTGSFGNAVEIMKIGEATARDHQEEFQELARLLQQFDSPPPVMRPELEQEITVDRVEVNGNRTFSDVEILGRLEVRQGRRIRPAKLDSMIHTLYGSNYFEKVSYSLHREQEENVLKISAKEKSPVFLKLSLLFDNYHSAGFIFDLTARNLLWKRSRLVIHGQVSNNYRFGASFLQHLSRNQRLMAEGSVFLNRDRMPFIWNGVRFGRSDQFRLPFDLKFKYRAGRNSMIYWGGELEYLNINTNSGDLSLFEGLRLVNLNGLVGLEVNTLDRHHLPRKGIKLNVEAKVISNLREEFSKPDSLFLEVEDSIPSLLTYPRLQVRMESHIPIGPWWQLSLNPSLGLLWSRENSYNDLFMMGSPVAVSELSLPFLGYGANNFATSMSMALEAGGHYFIRDDLSVGVLANAGLFQFPGPDDSAPLPFEDLQFFSSVSIRGGYQFLLGLLSVDLSYPIVASDDVSQGFNVFINFGYRF